MSTKGTEAPIVNQEAIDASDAQSEGQVAPRMGEGLGVFRALLLTAFFYIACGSLVWFAWHMFRQWRRH